MIVHHHGIVVHAIEHPHLAGLAKLLIERGYDLGVRREVLAHALAFESVEAVVGNGLLRPEDLYQAELALEAGHGEVDLDSPAWGAPEGNESPLRADDDCWSSDPDPAIGGATPEPEPCKCHGDRGPDGLTLDRALEAEITRYRGWGSPIGEFLGDQLERIRQTARFCGATTPAEYVDRVEVLELEARATYYDRGHADGAAGTYSFVA